MAGRAVSALIAKSDKDNMDCKICKKISEAKEGKNLNFIKELNYGIVELSPNQFYRGFVIFSIKDHIVSLEDLKDDVREKFLLEMAQVGSAVKKTFSPKHINYALQGNKQPHLHWHIVPRYKDDPNPSDPIYKHDHWKDLDEQDRNLIIREIRKYL
jgi:diadenosine tetraphosphate (Ap4A) HIT family hydrolase